MTRTFAAIAAAGATALAGCANAIVVPVTGYLGDGTPITGQATGNINGDGDFWAELPTGVRCQGTYDAFSLKNEFILPIRCGDGRGGEARIKRTWDGLAGSAVVALDDGTRAYLVFGGMRYEQAFPPNVPVP